MHIFRIMQCLELPALLLQRSTAMVPLSFCSHIPLRRTLPIFSVCSVFCSRSFSPVLHYAPSLCTRCSVTSTTLFVPDLACPTDSVFTGLRLFVRRRMFSGVLYGRFFAAFIRSVITRTTFLSSSRFFAGYPIEVTVCLVYKTIVFQPLLSCHLCLRVAIDIHVPPVKIVHFHRSSRICFKVRCASVRYCKCIEFLPGLCIAVEVAVRLVNDAPTRVFSLLISHIPGYEIRSPRICRPTPDIYATFLGSFSSNRPEFKLSVVLSHINGISN
jgi:hypothetical protein